MTAWQLYLTCPATREDLFCWAEILNACYYLFLYFQSHNFIGELDIIIDVDNFKYDICQDNTLSKEDD